MGVQMPRAYIFDVDGTLTDSREKMALNDEKRL